MMPIGGVRRSEKSRAAAAVGAARWRRARGLGAAGGVQDDLVSLVQLARQHLGELVVGDAGAEPHLADLVPARHVHPRRAPLTLAATPAAAARTAPGTRTPSPL